MRTSGMGTVSAVSTVRSERRTLIERLGIRAVILDKDGTLISHDSTWITAIVDVLHEVIPAQSLRADVLSALGITADGSVRPASAVGSGTVADCTDTIARVLRAGGFSYDRIDDVLTALRIAITDYVALARPRPVGDVAAVFAGLHQLDLATAVISNDEESHTAAVLSELGLSAAIDFVAGWRPGLPAKPDPRRMFEFCNRFAIPPETTVVVGDSPLDMEMGSRGGAALRIGVLTGVATAADLQPTADLVIPSIESLIPLLTATL